MAEPWTELPTDLPPASGERPTLEDFLCYQRAVLARKAEGLTDEQARRAACPPSDLTMLGLIRHMAEVERIWAHRAFSGEATEPIFYGAAHPDGDVDGDFHAPPGATLDEAFTAYWSEIASADAVYAAATLDDVERNDRAEHNLRWILVHLIEEYARHCGHADLLREAIDGRRGD